MPFYPPEETSEFDELTSLPAMMYFRRHANAYVQAAKRWGHTPYLVFFNLENFSVFNERYGFEEGDRLLALMAVAIQEAFPGFLLSRFSGDHFLLVCESRSLEASILEVRDQLHVYGRHANLELKAGIYRFDDDSLDIGLACDRAKIACDSIAHRYDRTFRYYDEALNWQVERSQYIESHIDQAVERGWIKVYYQPIVRTITGEVCEFEALARWDDPHYGFLAPAVFIDVLEKARLIHKLDRCMLNRVCEEFESLDFHGRVPVSINLSRLDFELTDVFAMVEKVVHDHHIPRQMLHLEVTESALNTSADLLVSEVNRLRETGYQVWLDDFGSGYSSLNTLKDYVFDVVKIDMAFLREFESKPKSRVIIASIVNMAKQLGMQTLIEGVETPEQFDFVREIGCELAQGYLVGKPMSKADSRARVRAGELVLGDLELSGYFDRLGSINTLSATPFEFPWEAGTEDRALAEMLPLAIIERAASELRFVSATDSFVEVLTQVGVGSMAHVADVINRGDSVQGRLIQRAVQTAVESRGIETIDVVANGHHCIMRVRFVANHDTVDALLVSLLNLSRFSNVAEEKRLQIALQYLYTVYEEVNIVDLADGMVTTLYRGNTSYPTVKSNVSMKDASRGFASEFVHPDDRERCIHYLDVTTVEQRVEASNKNYLADAFRTLRPDGTYGWLTSVLVPVIVDGERALLVCVRQTNSSVVESVEQTSEISKSVLWDTLIDLVPAGVFWKDQDRRFLGVNRNFLEFYDFDSVNDVLGKTDEDMGWHVDVDPFMNNELRVINEGEPVLNAQGTCIARGEVRHIVASKIPLRQNGEVVGLLGYFTDQVAMEKSQRGLLVSGFDRASEIDQLTGIPNLRGIRSSVASYLDVAQSGGPRFVYVTCDIRGMRDFNEMYGRSFGNRILKAVAQTLTHSYGVNSVVARVGGDEFALLRQVVRDTDPSLEAEHMKGIVEGIREVDGVYVSLWCLTGWASSNEAHTAAEVLALAEQRMHEER